MEQTKRSPNLAKLYNKKTDSVLEWVCSLLGEESSMPYQDIESYFNTYLAYTEEHAYLLDSYYDSSLSYIKKLQNCSDRLPEINALYEQKVKSLAQTMRLRRHKEVERELKDFFSTCDLICLQSNTSKEMVA